MEVIQINDVVNITLETYGANILNSYNHDINQGLSEQYHVKTTYEDGDTYECMLWQLFPIFGNIRHGSAVPFKDLKKVR